MVNILQQLKADIDNFKKRPQEDLKDIIDIQLFRRKKKLAQQKVSLNVTPEAKTLLSRSGYEPVYGARPLKRIIQQKIVDELAMELLEGKFKENDKISIAVDKQKEEFVFKKKWSPTPM